MKIACQSPQRGWGSGDKRNGKQTLFCFSFFLLTTDDVIALHLRAHFYKFQKTTQVLSILTTYFYVNYMSQIQKYKLVRVVVLEGKVKKTFVKFIEEHKITDVANF